MTIEGMPDPDVHRICRRYGQWFEADEGTYLAPEITGPLGAVRAMRAGIDGSGIHFQCARCTRIRNGSAFARTRHEVIRYPVQLSHF